MAETKELTNSLIKEKATDALVYRRSLTASDHVDDITTPGIYPCNNSPKGLPNSIYKYGVLKVSGMSPRILQEFFPDFGNKTPAWRIKVGASWNEWRTYAGETYP